MPGMDGFEVCRKMRETLDVPIIFLSSRRDLMDKLKCFELAGGDYVTKPFHFTELEARRSAEHTSELQSRGHIVCRLLLEKKRMDSPARAAVSGCTRRIR